MTTTIEVRAPKEQSEGTRSQVHRWLKNIGEPVAENEPLIEVETDKVTIEIPAPAGGVLREILKHEQEEIEPGELLGTIQAMSEGTAPEATAAPPVSKQANPAAEIRTAALVAHADALAASQVSPAVRRLLTQHGIEPSAIRGSGADRF